MNEQAVSSAIPPGTPFASQWALVAGSIGKGAVYAAGILFLLAALCVFLPARFKSRDRFARASFTGGTLALLTAFGALGLLFVKDQFEYQYVFNHSDLNNAIQYKIASIWTAQEGSFLLWGVMSALLGTWAIFRAKFERFAPFTIGVFLAGIAGILAYESPFSLLSDVAHAGRVFIPPNGGGMTPSLQNYWVTIHPPTIFTGFGMLIVPFGFALSGILRRDLTSWIAPIRPFLLAGVAILGLGISMGGLWAYETQGWGGFWMWDPVENVSLVPWLFLVASAHGILLQARTGAARLANVTLALIPFLAFVYGTFLTRSGLLDKVSVHSFASMDEHARVILRYMLLATTVVVIAGIARAWQITKAQPVAKPQPRADAESKGYERGAGYSAGILLLSMVGIIVSIGMSWPAIQALRGGQGERIEEPLYDRSLYFFFIPIILLMTVGPFLTWKREGGREVWKRVMNAFSLAMAIFGVGLLLMKAPGSGIYIDFSKKAEALFHLHVPVWLALGTLVFFCVFAFSANLLRAVSTAKRAKLTLGGLISHAGIAMLFAGLILSHGLERKETLMIRPGVPASALGYTVTYDDIESKDIWDRDGKVKFTVADPSGRTFPARPGLYYYEGQEGQPTAMVWPHIERRLSHDVYLALHEPITQVFEKPLEIKPGETKTQDGLTIEYVKPTLEGPLGSPGAKFGAVLNLTYKGDTHQARPTLEMTSNGLVPELADAGPNFRVALEKMDAKDRSVTVMPLFSPPIYPVELFEKPMTSLVWIGTGVFTVGGIMAAFARRRKPTGNDSADRGEPLPSDDPRNDHLGPEEPLGEGYSPDVDSSSAPTSDRPLAPARASLPAPQS